MSVVFLNIAVQKGLFSPFCFLEDLIANSKFFNSACGGLGVLWIVFLVGGTQQRWKFNWSPSKLSRKFCVGVSQYESRITIVNCLLLTSLFCGVPWQGGTFSPLSFVCQPFQWLYHILYTLKLCPEVEKLMVCFILQNVAVHYYENKPKGFFCNKGDVLIVCFCSLLKCGFVENANIVVKY